jgi:hypothetical protein
MKRDLEKEWIPEWIPFLGAVAHPKQKKMAGWINKWENANDISYTH